MSDAVTIEGYAIHELTGRGGIGDVYRATHLATGATVAVKVLREITDGSAAWRRCRRELTALLALSSHPHVIRVIEVAAVGAHPALVMEFAPGGSAHDRVVARGAPLDPAEVVRIGRQAASALAEAHARGIVHRDVKPHNLLLTAHGDVKLCDFGIAAIARSAELRHATANVSLRFASPEDLEGDAEVGPPADVYSLGATLLYLARGEHLDLRDRLVAWAPPTPADSEDLARIDAVISACLQPDPAMRPAAAAVAEQLAVTVGPQPALAEPAQTVPRPVAGYRPPAPPRPSPRVPRPHRRRALIAAASVAVGALTTVGVLWWLTADRAGPTDVPGVVEPGVVEVVGRPTGLVDLTAVAWPAGPVGECLVQHPGQPALSRGDCAQAHDLQRIAVGDVPAAVPADADQLEAAVEAACAREVAALAAGSSIPLVVAMTRPSEAGWAAGDRQYQCFVGVPEQRLTGGLPHAHGKAPPYGGA